MKDSEHGIVSEFIETGDNDILNDFDVNNINKLKIKEFLMNGRAGEAAIVMQNIVSELGKNRFDSLMLRHYITMHIYSVCRTFADSIGVDKTEFEEFCGEPAVLLQNTNDVETIIGYLTELLEQCIDLRRNTFGKTSGDAINKAKDYIYRNYADSELSMASVAKASCISPAYFSSTFKKTEGITFIDYLTKVRLQKAKELLILTSKSVIEIAFEVGFNDPKYFSQLFKKYYGMSPKDYRQNKKSFYVLDANEKPDIEQLLQSAFDIRRNITRSAPAANFGHAGESFDVIDILTALYFHAMNIDPKNLHDENRDRFVLSKCRAAPALYATLAERGYFPKEELAALGKSPGSHPNMNTTADVDMSDGSAGQGISAAASMALGLKLKGGIQRVYTLLGGGEVEENEAWEAFLIAAHYRLENLCVIIKIYSPQNNKETDDDENALPLEENSSPLKDKLQTLGFYAIECDGNSIAELIAAFDEAKNIQGQPVCILTRIHKNANEDFIENNAGWHSHR